MNKTPLNSMSTEILFASFDKLLSGGTLGANGVMIAEEVLRRTTIVWGWQIKERLEKISAEIERVVEIGSGSVSLEEMKDEINAIRNRLNKVLP